MKVNKYKMINHKMNVKKNKKLKLQNQNRIKNIMARQVSTSKSLKLKNAYMKKKEISK